MPIRGTFNSAFLRRMDSEPTTNRKGFLKRAGLAIAGVFAVSSIARTSRSDRSDRSDQTQTASQGISTSASANISASALARVRTAKGAVARKV